MDKQPYERVYDFLLGEKVDILFFLAVSMWIKKWKEFIVFSKNKVNTIVFETNIGNNKENKEFLDRTFGSGNVIHVTGYENENQGRSLYICHTKN